MIEVNQLTKLYGRTAPRPAVDALSFHAPPGSVTGFLGPNGAGKSTTMRVVLGLDAPTSGAARVNGRPYAGFSRPLHEVGALLDAGAVHGGRSAVNHLRWLARTHRIGRRRVDAVLEQVGLGAAAGRRVSGFSLGMRQRLGIAAALLGDPGVLILDEPVNGLDPDGVRWFREYLRELAGEGRTVLVSSHLMGEMELTADRLVIIGRGRLIADTSVRELTDRYSTGVLVRSPRAAELAALLEAAGARVAAEPGDRLVATGLEVSAIGELAAERSIAVWEITPRNASLEDAYMQLTAEEADFRASTSTVASARETSG
ncbi:MULTISPECIES: ABC transporter ATP-binding protein [unclassified Streptomyces]|uniref:ABC transporter ATP-binding protein n=1 Tax=unclassified Streptomyces TaxID=2593676 RepID=UPI0037FA9811